MQFEVKLTYISFVYKIFIYKLIIIINYIKIDADILKLALSILMNTWYSNPKLLSLFLYKTLDKQNNPASKVTPCGRKQFEVKLTQLYSGMCSGRVEGF